MTALAGEMAIKESIVPWPKGTALNAAVEIFGLWRAEQPRSPKGKEFAQIINGVREFIEVHGADFFDSEWVPEYDPNSSRIVNAEPVIRERAGYWKDTANERHYMFNADGIKRASSGFGVRKALEALNAAGALMDRDAGRLTKKCWIPQLKRSLDFYLIDPKKLELAPQ
jgi:putative DNA primase/helicase